MISLPFSAQCYSVLYSNHFASSGMEDLVMLGDNFVSSSTWLHSFL